MKVLLQRDVPHLGKAGEVKEVTEGYARNYLLPQGWAVLVTPDALRRRSQEADRRLRAQEAEKKNVQALAEKLKRLTVEIRVPSTPEGRLYGGIHRERIVQALKEKGIIIETQSIALSEPLKTVGSRQVGIHLKFGVTARLQIEVRGESQ